MNRLRLVRKLGKVGAAGLLTLGITAGVQAFERPCPPCYQYPPGSQMPYRGAPAQPGVPTPARPGEAPVAPRTGENGRAPQDQAAQQQAQTQQQPTDFTPSADSSGRASLAPGMNTPQLGRLDQANRLNLFDNMTAAPQNKVWVGLQYSTGIDTGLTTTPTFDAFFAGLPVADQADFTTALAPFRGEQKQVNFRVGAEALISCDLSFAIQGQYFTNETEGSAFGDDWSNPQFLLKYVLSRDCDTVLSATLGATTQTGVDPGDLDENTTKFYPGLLYYETLNRNLFTQGGFQFGLPIREDQIYTFDWSLSLGYWLYRDCSLTRGHCCCNSGQVTGIIPQIGVLGKHVIGDETRANAFGFNSAVVAFDADPADPLSPTFTGDLFIYREPQDVLDLTVGTLIIVGCDIQVGLGYSLPITDDDVRDHEFLSYVNYLY